MSSRAAAGAHEAPRRRVGSRFRLTARAAIVLTVVVLLAVTMVYPVRLYLDQRAELQRMEQETAEMSKVNQDLTIELERLSDPAYLEELARSCLGMVRRGETAFAVVPKDGVPEPVPCTPTA